MLHLNHTGVEVLINRFKSPTKNAFWENYDLILWNKNSSGYTNIKGLFKNDAWGIAERVSVNSNGTWILPKTYVKYFK